MSSYLPYRASKYTSFQSLMSTLRSIQAGLNQFVLVSRLLFSMYVNDMSRPRSLSFVVGYLETYLSRFEHWLRAWGIAMNI